jgi:hypothetical protein
MDAPECYTWGGIVHVFVRWKELISEESWREISGREREARAFERPINFMSRPID